MGDFRADLHVHSIFSDGSDTPEKLIDMALEKGLQGLSITDHDTVGAYDRGLAYAEKRGFSLLTGVEFSAVHKEESVHVLGYGFPIESREIENLCLRHFKRREERNREILQNLKKLNISISEEELKEMAPQGVVGRPHIAIILIRRGIVATMKEAFQRYLGEDKPGFAAGIGIGVEETIEIIRRAGGKAILAHPMLIVRKRLFEALLQMPFDGLEGYYGSYPLDEEKYFIKRAEEKGWIVTGGSDYHGSIKPNTFLGSSWVGLKTFQTFYKKTIGEPPSD